MKFLRKSASLLALAGLFSAAGTASAAETIALNKTHVMRLSAPAGAVVIGNPKIADVSVHSDNTLFVFGRGFGQTDILILDTAGNTLVHTDITVVEQTNEGTVRVITPGAGNQTFDCKPYCRPAPAFADDPEFKGKYSAAVAATAGGGTAAMSGAGQAQADTGTLSGGTGESARSGLSGEFGGNNAQSARSDRRDDERF